MRKLSLLSFLVFFQCIAAWSQGTPLVSQQFVNGQGGGNLAYLIATTVADNAGDYDHMHIVATINCNDYFNCNSTIDLTLGNRGGFGAVYTAKGANPTGLNVHIAAYRQADTTTRIYMMLADNYVVASYAILENSQDTVYTSPIQTINTTPPGTLVFDTASAAYPPANYTDFAGNFFPSGHVGIGTASPNGLLDLFSSTQLSNRIRLSGQEYYQPGNSSANGIDFRLGVNRPGERQLWIADSAQAINSTNPLMRVRFGGSSFVSLDSISTDGTVALPLSLQGIGGNVGIGTLNPGATLDVAGNIKISGGSGNHLIFPDGTTQSTAYPGASGSLTVAPGSGNVGIGTASPQAALDVEAFSQVSPGIGLNLLNTSGYPESASLTRILFAGYGLPTGFAMIQAGGTDWGSGNGFLGLQTALGGTLAERVRITSNGSVGIGTTTPTQMLEVKGNVKISGVGANLTFPDGTVQATAWNGTTLGGDYAESIDVLGDRATYEPGDVIVIDDSETGKFDKSSKPYSKMVAGVYSTKPGLVGRRLTADRPDKEAEVPMAMMGIVPTKVSAENGPIERGDLLVSSSMPGYAMKGSDRDRLTGAVIGKALAPLKSGNGVIEVLLALQ